jgi:hypothetical protein
MQLTRRHFLQVLIALLTLVGLPSQPINVIAENPEPPVGCFPLSFPLTFASGQEPGTLPEKTDLPIMREG